MLNRIAVCMITIALFVGALYAHGDPVMGTVTAITSDTFTIKDKANKTVVIMLEKGTKYIKADKAVTKSELQVGSRVIIDAHMDTKMKMLSAEEVTIGTTATPAAPKK